MLNEPVIDPYVVRMLPEIQTLSVSWMLEGDMRGQLIVMDYWSRRFYELWHPFQRAEALRHLQRLASRVRGQLRVSEAWLLRHLERIWRGIMPMRLIVEILLFTFPNRPRLHQRPRP